MPLPPSYGCCRSVLFCCPTVVVSYANVFVPHTHTHTHTSVHINSLSWSLWKVCLLLRMLISALHDNLLRLPHCIFLLFFTLILWHVKLNAPQQVATAKATATTTSRDCLSVYLTCILLHFTLVISILFVFAQSRSSKEIASKASKHGKGKQKAARRAWFLFDYHYYLCQSFSSRHFPIFQQEKRIKACPKNLPPPSKKTIANT